METRRNTPPPFRNRILRRLPAAMLRRLRRDLKEVDLEPRDSLYEPNVPGKYVYFPETGAAAIVTVLKNGTEPKSRPSVMKAWSDCRLSPAPELRREERSGSSRAEPCG